MAPNSDLSGSSALDGLLKKRQTISATRAEEDVQLAKAQKKEDEELELAKKNATSPWERERTNRLAQHKSESVFSFNTLGVQHAQELADLQKRQAVEASALKRSNTQKERNIEQEFTASYANCATGVESRIKVVVNARERNEMELKRKRDTEDGQLRNDVLLAFEGIALPVQDDRRQSSSTNAVSAVEKIDISEEQHAGKRLKVENVAEAGIPAYVAPVVEDSFRLKAIQSTFDGSSDAWYSNVWGSEKIYRFNVRERLFSPYNGVNCEAESHPRWVLKVPRYLKICFNRPKARIFISNTDAGTLRAEFCSTAEFDRFVQFCNFQNLGIKFLGCKIQIYLYISPIYLTRS